MDTDFPGPCAGRHPERDRERANDPRHTAWTGRVRPCSLGEKAETDQEYRRNDEAEAPDCWPDVVGRCVATSAGLGEMADERAGSRSLLGGIRRVISSQVIDAGAQKPESDQLASIRPSSGK